MLNIWQIRINNDVEGWHKMLNSGAESTIFQINLYKLQGRTQDLLVGGLCKGEAIMRCTKSLWIKWKCQGGVEENGNRIMVSCLLKNYKLRSFQINAVYLNTGKSGHFCDIPWYETWWLVQCIYRLLGLSGVIRFVTRNMKMSPVIMWYILCIMSLKYLISRSTDHLFQGGHLCYEKENFMFKFLLHLVNLHQLVEKAGLEQTSRVCSLVNLSAIRLGIDVFTEVYFH